MSEDNPSISNYLDLRGVPCPNNYVRSSLAIEDLNDNQSIIIDLDKGEPYEMVFNGLKRSGHNIKMLKEDDTWMRLLVICCVKQT